MCSSMMRPILLSCCLQSFWYLYRCLMTIFLMILGCFIEGVQMLSSCKPCARTDKKKITITKALKQFSLVQPLKSTHTQSSYMHSCGVNLSCKQCESNIDHVIEEHATHQITCQLTPYT